MKYLIMPFILFVTFDASANELVLYESESDENCTRIELIYLDKQTTNKEYTCAMSRFILRDIESISIKDPALPSYDKKCSNQWVQFSKCDHEIVIRLSDKYQSRLQNWSEKNVGSFVYLAQDRSVILILWIQEVLSEGKITFSFSPRIGVDPKEFFEQFTDDLRIVN